jgi:hypothetical protein
MGWTASATAQMQSYPLAGDGGYWIGGGMPVPITRGVTKAGPNQRMKATPSATVMQPTLAPDPRSMKIAPGQITKPSGYAYAGQFPNNPALFMVTTTLNVQFPAAAGIGSPPAPGTVTFKAAGRTGPPTYTFAPPVLAGTMTYKALKAQFGGPGQSSLVPAGGGVGAGIFGVVASPAPCKHTALGGPNPGCLAVKALAAVAPLVAAGAPFGYVNSTSPPSATPPNVYAVGVVSTGTITTRLGVGTTPFKNNATSYGGPWTTGQLIISQPAAKPPEKYTLTGSDQRVNGFGGISLVSGSLSNRLVSGPNANRGWLDLYVQAPRLPSVSSWGIASLGLGLLGIGAAGLALARRRK